jgi:predicted RNase H-like HicB family nuclease
MPAVEWNSMAGGWFAKNEAGRYREMKYAVVFEQGPSSVGATVPDLPGCVAVAKPLEETRTLIAEAIEFHIEGMRLHGEHVPEPTTMAELVEVG